MTPGRRMGVVDELRGIWKISIRRACSAIQAQRSSYFYRSRRPDRAPLTTRIREIAETRVRYGYRRIHVLMRREGWLVNAKLVNRLYREMSLQLRNKSPKRKVTAKLREGRQTPVARNDVWAMDFVHVQLFDATKVRVLTVVDASPGSFRRSNRARTGGDAMSSMCLSGSPGSTVFSAPSALAKSSSRRNWISGPTAAA